MRRFLVTYRLYFWGLIAGVIAGFVYWHYAGCLSGTCSITSNPYRSMAYFGLMGSFLFGMFDKEDKKKPPLKEPQTQPKSDSNEERRKPG